MSTHRDRRSKADLRAYWIGGAAVVLLVSFVGVAAWIQLQQVPVGDDLCPVGADPAAVWVILLDVTDAYSPVQREFVKNAFDTIKQEVAESGRLSLYLLGSSPVDLSPLRSICNPGGGDDGSPVEWLTSNPRLRRERWEVGFNAPLDGALQSAFREEGASSSPILEQIQAIAVSGLHPFDGVPRRLIVVSDFMHHTPELSHYQGVPDYERFRESGYYDQVRADLSGTEVQLLYVRRSGTLPQDAVAGHIDFWAAYFRDMNAVLGYKQPNGMPAPAVVRVPG